MSRRGRGVHDRVVSLPFRVVASTIVPKTVSLTVTELEVVPANLGTRVVATASCFEYYRVKDLHLQAFSSVVGPTHYDSDILNVTLGTISAIMAIAYEPSDTTRTGVPTGLNQMAQSSEFRAGNIRSNLDLRIPRSTLMGAPLKWWNTTSTGSPTETLVQGLIWTYANNYNANEASGADVVHVVVSGTIEFKGMIDPSLAFSTTPHSKPEVVDEDKTSETDSLAIVSGDGVMVQAEPSIRNACLADKRGFVARVAVPDKEVRDDDSTVNRVKRPSSKGVRSAGPSFSD